MKKVIRLTESDLVRLVKRVINEQQVSNTGKVHEIRIAPNNKWLGKYDIINLTGQRDASCSLVFTPVNRNVYNLISRNLGLVKTDKNTFIYNPYNKGAHTATSNTAGPTATTLQTGMSCPAEELLTTNGFIAKYQQMYKTTIKPGDTIKIIFTTT